MDTKTDLFSTYEKAEGLIAEGNLRAAADLCKEMMDANPQYPYGYHLMASLFNATGTFERALTFAQTATQLAPGIAKFHIQHGQLLYSLGEYEAASASFMSAFQLEPHNPIALLLLASTFVSREQYDEARGLFLHARNISDIPEIDEQEGLCYVAQGNYTEAEHSFDQVIKRNPNYIWGHIYKGQVLMNSKNLSQAEASMARALKIDPQSFEALFALAVLNDWQGQSEIAIRYVMEAIKSKPLGWEAHTFLGALLVRERHYLEAQQVLAQALTIRPDDAYVLQHLFLALRMTQREPEFVFYLKKQLERSTGNSVLLHFMAIINNSAPNSAPAAYIQKFFDSFSGQYDYYQENILAYKVPSIIAQTVKKWLDDNNMPIDTMLDLGCGTGLVARALHDITTTRIGVDISPRMLAMARGKQLYQTLHLDDMLSFMLKSQETFDLVIASDSLCHCGDLAPFLRAARNVLNKSSLLVLTIERESHIEKWRLRSNGRYVHSIQYIKELLVSKGYEILHQHELTLHIDNNIAAPGILFLARKIQTH